MYVYIKSKSERLWTVGFYDPAGNWQPESDQPEAEEAAKRVAWLNGSGDQKRIEHVEAKLAELQRTQFSHQEILDQPNWRERR